MKKVDIKIIGIKDKLITKVINICQKIEPLFYLFFMGVCTFQLLTLGYYNFISIPLTFITIVLILEIGKGLPYKIGFKKELRKYEVKKWVNLIEEFFENGDFFLRESTSYCGDLYFCVQLKDKRYHYYIPEDSYTPMLIAAIYVNNKHSDAYNKKEREKKEGEERMEALRLKQKQKTLEEKERDRKYDRDLDDFNQTLNDLGE